MKQYYILSIIWLSMVAASIGQNHCDSIFYRLDPLYMTLNTQQLIINQVLQCQIDAGAPDSMSLFDRYYTGTNAINSGEAEQIFYDIMREYTASQSDVELFATLQNLSNSTYRSPIFSYDTDLLGILTDGNSSPFVDAQIERLFGNASDSYFANDIEYMPDSIALPMEEFAARKIAFMEAKNNSNIFDEAFSRSDSLQYLHNHLNIALYDPNKSLSPLFNRHMNTYIYLREDTIRAQAQAFLGASQQAISAGDTAFVQAIDDLGTTASKRYETYRNDEMLKIAHYYDTITTNTQLNAEALECVQNELASDITLLDNLEAAMSSSPNPLGDLELHGAQLRKVIESGNLVDAYMKGDIDPSAILSSGIGPVVCANGNTIAETLQQIIGRPDLATVGRIMRAVDTYKADVNRFDTRSLGFTAAAGGVAVYGVAKFTMGAISFSKAKIARAKWRKQSGLGKAFFKGPKRSLGKRAVGKLKKLFSPKNAKNLLKKLWPKGAKALAKGGIQGYVMELVAKEILHEAVTAPILEAIDGLRKEMNARFDIVDQKLDAIIKMQIESTQAIMDGLQANHEFMQRQFNNINFNLAEILENQEQIQSQLHTLLIQDLQHCGPIQNTIESINPIEAYSDLIFVYNNTPNMPSCLNGLQDALNGPANCADLAFFEAYSNGNAYAEREIDNFEKARKLFQFLYGPQQKNIYYEATQALVTYSDHTVDNQWDALKLVQADQDMLVDPSDVLGSQYLDAHSLVKILGYFETFNPYFEVYQNGNPALEPMSMEQYLMVDSSAREFRVNFIKGYAENLLCVSKVALAQQSLMSGSMLIDPIYRILYEDAYAGATITVNNVAIDLRRFCIDMLYNNSVLASNFFTMTARYNYDRPMTQTKNFIANGNFNSEQIDFTSDYTYADPYTAAGQYAVVSKPSQWASFAHDWPGHTGNNNDRYLVNGPDAAGTIWQKSVRLPAGKFRFSCYAGDVEEVPKPNFPEIVLIVNDTVVSETLYIDTVGQWDEIYLDFELHDSSTLVDLKITNASGEIYGNDVMIDDISLVHYDNLIVNGDFSQGNQGFFTTMTHTTQHSGSDQYSIVDDPNAWWSAMERPYHSPPGVSGNMLVSDGNGSYYEIVFEQPVQLDSGALYELTLYVAEGTTPTQRPIIEAGMYSYADDNFTPMIYSYINENQKWIRLSHRFIANPHPTDSVLRIYNRMTTQNGNNLIMDNISLIKLDDIILTDPVDYWEIGHMTNSTSSANIASESLYKDLSFVTTDTAAISPQVLLEMEVDQALCNDPYPFVCSVKIPRPSPEILSEDKFSYTEAHATLKPVMQRVVNQHVNIHIPSYYPTDWQQSFIAKSILTNKSNQ